MSKLATDFKSTFGSFSSALAILISSASIINFTVRLLKLGITPFLLKVVDAYRVVFHPLVDALTFWLPFSFSPVIKDSIVIWFAVSGALVRSWMITEKLDTGKGMALGQYFLACFVCISLMPVQLLATLLMDKHLYRHPETGALKSSSRGEVKSIEPSYVYLYGTRRVFLMQISAVACVVVVTILLNLSR